MLLGDKFPDVEILLTDSTNQTIFLHTYKTGFGAHTGPFHLIGEGRLYMGSYFLSLKVNTSGVFLNSD